jgi:hypothetical protein
VHQSISGLRKRQLESAMTYYVKTQVELKFGQNAGFNEVLSHLAPFLKKHGWKLTHGLQALIGSLTEIIHIWEVEDLNHIPAGLNAVFSDPELGKQLARLPDFMNTESLTVMVKTPYSP